MARSGKPQSREPSQRQLRVGEEVRHALSAFIQRGDFRDPDLVDVQITVTEVRISPDLKNATAFIVPLGGGDASAAIAALSRARGFLRTQVARQMQLKHVPRLSFQPDKSFDEAGHIHSLLAEPKVARDVAAPDDDPDDEDA